MRFTETVSAVDAIKKILHDYPFSASILRELLQNSDDARATKQVFVLDKGENPALMAYNDAQFGDDDWTAIRRIHQSSKKADTSKIGKYGVGFRACYHITDGPQILSGGSFAILDPLHSGGTKIDYDEFKKTVYQKHFDFFYDHESASYPGTVIRLPLRQSPSELSKRTVHVDELHQLIRGYIAEELNISLLFLENLRTIEIWESDGAKKYHLASWTKSEATPVRQRLFVTYDSVLSNEMEKFSESWRIIQTQYSDEEAKSRLAGESANYIFQEHKLQFDVRLAYPLSSEGYASGRLFTYLPLPSKTNFPAHIHALFALTSSRQGLRNSNETGIVSGSENDILVKWNKLLFDDYIPQAWSCLLMSLTEDGSCKNIYSAWPPYLSSSITSGDGLYWQNILSNTFNVAVRSGLAIWPSVSAKDMPTFVHLKSSLVVSEGEVDLDVLIALDQLGLTLVQLPQDHMRLLDSSIAKLTPGSAYASLELHETDILQTFEGLSAHQRGILCKYFLSDKDFNHIYGLPLFPTLDGSYVSLSNRMMTSRRYIAMTSEEVEVFGASASDAIPLAHLDSEISTLIRERGTSQANIDLLSPQVVIVYLSNELEFESDKKLTKFWLWLSKWHLKDEMMNLLKVNSTLRLVPTSKGLQPVSLPVFLRPHEIDYVRLFEKFGLAFIDSVLPSSVLHLLDSHKVVKDTNSLFDLLSAVDINVLDSLSLSNNEAKLAFNHFAAHYKPVLPGYLSKLKKFPIFPVLVPDMNVHGEELSNASVAWRNINDFTIKGISPMRLIPVVENVQFLDKASIEDPSCSLLKGLQINILKDEDVLLLALDHFQILSKSLQAAFVSYIKIEHSSNRLPKRVKLMLGKTKFIPTSDGTLQSPQDVIDPMSYLILLFPLTCEDFRVPKNDDHYDHKIFDDLRALKLTKTSLSSDIIQDRISYISLNYHRAMDIARFLVSLMNNPNFPCAGLSIDLNVRWLPTQAGLVSPKECIDGGRQDAYLFDQVLAILDGPKAVSPSFKALMGWDKSLPLEVLTKQLSCVLGTPDSETNCYKVREIIRELARRSIGDADIRSIGEVVAGRPWVPTKSNTLAPHSRAVFTSVPDDSGFYEIGFSKSDKRIYQFLTKMGCHERPTAAAIISELESLRAERVTIIVVKQAVKLLEMLPASITDLERASLLVPTRTGELVSLGAGVCYYKGNGIISETDQDTPIAHRLVNEQLAEKIKLRPLGLNEADNDIDLGESPITTISNTLRQYDPKQFFTEFIANASDANANHFSILVDDYEGPTTNLISGGLAAFQGASLVVHNDGVFSWEDFRGILQTGIGGKRGKSGMIGRFGLGALSMFHFTELAMVVSGRHVLFMGPLERKYFCGKRSIIFELQELKRLYADHLEPLNGLFNFDINSDEPYNGTLFRLPLRNQSHPNGHLVSTTAWSVDAVQDMFLREFDSLAYKSLLFTGLSNINVSRRQNSRVKALRSICSVRTSHNSDSFKSEVVAFKTKGQELPEWLVVSMKVDIPEDYKAGLDEKYDMHHLLPVRIAAPLDSAYASNTKNLFCSLPLPATTSLPVHISAPLILEQERRNIRLDVDKLGIESKYNLWLLSEVPRLYLFLLERLLQVQDIRTNVPWWPVMGRHDTNVASRIIMAAFWHSNVLEESARLVFASKYDSDIALSPKEAVLFPKSAYLGFRKIISKIFSITRPLNIAEVSKELFECTSEANLQSVDAKFVKRLLENGDLSNQLSMDEIEKVLSFLSAEVTLDGLPLLPLADGSYTKILSQPQITMSKTYYKFDPALAATTIPFKKDHFVHKDFKAYEYLLNKGYNVSCLSEVGIVKLVEEYIKPALEFSGNDDYHALVLAFWNAPLNIAPEKFSHLPLIPTLRQSHFVSLNKVNDYSVVVVDSVVESRRSSHDEFDYGILQSLGMIIVVRKQLPKKLQSIGMKMNVYHTFLNYIQAKGFGVMQRLNSNDRQRLGWWVRSEFCHTPRDKADIACGLPVWPTQQRLVALDEATILPPNMPSEILQPFTIPNVYVVDWQRCMAKVKKEGCSATRITQILRVSWGTCLQADQQAAYKRFLRHFLGFSKVNGYTLLVPNENGVLTPVNELFERSELFMAAFETQQHRLLLADYGDLVDLLGIHGLNRGHRLDLRMFIECAKAFDKDRKHDRRERSMILYRYFNSLALEHRRDAFQCSQLDKLRFIPRANSPRAGYDNIDTRYIAEFQDILSPSEIVLPEYEPVCWSQRGRTHPPPNSTLCGTYQRLGQPSGREVMMHLKVLAKIGQTSGRRPALLLDLKATYKWLNDHVDEIRDDIRQERSEPLFLNVDDPDSDEWVWHSASNLVMDLQDVRKLRDVKDFLRNYNDLLKAADIRKIHNVEAEPVSISDRTTFFREKFNEMRLHGYDVNVVFKTKDKQHNVPPAHRTWLSVNGEFFWTLFFEAVGFNEAHEVNTGKCSSLCVKEVVDWIYTNKLPDSIIVDESGGDSDDEVSAKLGLALEMLSLAHYWEVTELHKHMQRHIINSFISPYTVRRIRMHAEDRMANELMKACKEYEEKNWNIIMDLPKERED